jgi:hypothetical protein
MHPLKMVETTPGNYSLLLDAGSTEVDELIEDLGHEPNGYFWEGVARLIIQNDAPTLADRLAYDPEGGMFCAYGTDRAALEELGARMSTLASDATLMRGLVEAAEEAGFEFDD